jgi:thiol-disulfide isomerase/thioredoxin
MQRHLTLGLAALLLAMAVFNFLLLNQNGRLRLQVQNANAKGEQPAGMEMLRFTYGLSPFFRILLEEKKVTRKPALSLLVFLSPGDCGVCLQESEVWEKLHKKYSAKGLFVAALVPQPDSQWGRQFREDYGFSFPVFPVNQTVLQALGVPPITPFKVMVDSLHRVVYLSGANSEPEDRKNFGEVAERLCQVYLKPEKVSFLR